MEILGPDRRRQGCSIQAGPSSTATVLEVLLSVRVTHRVFHGVRTERPDPALHRAGAEAEGLLWVFDDGEGLELRQDSPRGPRIVAGEVVFGVESIAGHYHSADDNVYIGVKWWGYDCPTWELEAEVPQHFHFDSLSDIVELELGEIAG